MRLQVFCLDICSMRREVGYLYGGLIKFFNDNMHSGDIPQIGFHHDGAD